MESLSTSVKAPFRHRPKHKVSMWHRSPAVPQSWRVVDFRPPGHQGRTLPGLGTRQMELLRLILDARDIPYFITGHGANMRAYVPALYETLARAELSAAAAEKSVPESVLPLRHNAHWVALILLLLIVWHGLRMGWWPLPGVELPGPNAWLQCGKLDIALVRAGEWWRTATALTLHTDSLHLFSNVLFSAPFLILLARRLGLGLTLPAILVSGILGNALDVLYRSPGYASLGASTAMFSTVGLLCADVVVRSPARGLREMALPAAAGMAFLAMLGSEGENVDYAAHVFGLAAGFAVGLRISLTIKHRSVPRALEMILGAAAAGFLALCWALAF